MEHFQPLANTFGVHNKLTFSKKLIALVAFVLVFFIWNPLFSQTTIKFLPQEDGKSLRQKTSAISTGEIEQFGNNFNGQVQIELPDKKLKLHFQPSSIKQYNLLKTTDGEVFTDVEVYESKGESGINYIVTINEQLYSFIESDQNTIFELRKNSKEGFTYRALEEYEIETTCLTPDNAKIDLNSNKNARSVNGFGCYEFPVVFINDYDHYLYNKNKSLAEIEAKNLSDLAGAQAIWNFGNTLRQEVRFRTLGQIIETDENNLLWSRDPNNNMGSRLEWLKEFWKKPKDWEVDYLTIVAVSGIRYPDQIISSTGQTPRTLTILGMASNFFNAFKIGSIIIRGYIDEEDLAFDSITQQATSFLLSHELGHIFGLKHTVGQGQNIMSGNGINSTKNWVPNHVDSIAITVGLAVKANAVDPCPRVYLSWEDESDGLKFYWTADIVSEQDKFNLEFSNDDGETWLNLGFANSSDEFALKVSDAEINSSKFKARLIQEGQNSAISNSVEIDLEVLRDIPESGSVVYYDQDRSNLVIKSSKPTWVEVYGINGKLIGKDYLKYYLLNIDTTGWVPGVHIVRVSEFADQSFKVLIF